MAVQVFGIRHHGVGSAQRVYAALSALNPDCVLVEGPPEADVLLAHLLSEAMQPPVAILAYVPDSPEQSMVYPFAEFSPEWQAMRWALRNQKVLRFMDLPLTHWLALTKMKNDAEKQLLDETESKEEVLENQDLAEASVESGDVDTEKTENPYETFAKSTGFAADGNFWEAWDAKAEMPWHGDAFADLAAIGELFSTLRQEFPENSQNVVQETRLREAAMRKILRAAEKEFASVAVICGANHVSALENVSNFPVKEDTALLKGLAKVKVKTTWLPWSFQRLTLASGYGAGIHAPAFFQACWQLPKARLPAAWLSQTAVCLRAQGFAVSSAQVIDALHLSENLAALRGKPMPTLLEFHEACQSVMTMGDPLPLARIAEKLLVGNVLGSIPDALDQPPIYHDFMAEVKSLRLKMTDEIKTLELDLRENAGLNKSIFLHRLTILGVHWGNTEAVGGTGTFKEGWRLQWQPDFLIRLLEAAPLGNTVLAAAEAKARFGYFNAFLDAEAQAKKSASASANAAPNLAELIQILAKALLADLPETLSLVLKHLDAAAADSQDTEALIAAFLPLLKVLRYGSVRQQTPEQLSRIAQSLFYRIIAALPIACRHLSTEAAETMEKQLSALHQAVLLEAPWQDDWQAMLWQLLKDAAVSPLLAGKTAFLLYSREQLREEALLQTFSQALSQDSALAASWLEGFLAGQAQTLIFEEEIFLLLNQWLRDLSAEAFVSVLPLLRRTTSSFSAAEKQKIFSRLNQSPSTKAKHVQPLNQERAARIEPMLRTIFLESSHDG
jgi:hypothetical protein